MKKILLTILTAIFAFGAQAQTIRTSYFMDKYANRHQRNPAMSPAIGYVNFPALGHLHLGLQSNMKLSDYLYPVKSKDGQLMTFMHQDISSKQFLRRIGRLGETLNLDGNFNILGFGFYTKHNRFWSFDMNMKANAGINIPKDVFAFLKKLDLGENGGFNWKNLNAAGRGYLELAIGHARDIEILGHDFRMGAKVKLLNGLGDFRLKTDDFSVHTSGAKWTGNADASVSALGGLVIFTEDEEGKFTAEIPEFEIANIINLGAAVDLGAVYNMDKLFELIPFLPPLKGFTASLGITDLGFIRYKKSSEATFSKDVWFDGAKIYRDTNNSIVADVDYFLEQFDDIAKNLQTTGEGGKISRGLRTTTNLGLEYSFMNNKMSAGLLYSTHWGLPRRFNELTLSYNLRPVRWYSLSLSTSIWNGFFRSAGWAMNFTPRYFANFFIGMDYVPIAYTPQYVPIHNANFNFNFGMSIPLGGNRSKEYGGTTRERKAIRRAERQQEVAPQQSVQEVYTPVEL
jgi:hypothetical protein